MITKSFYCFLNKRESNSIERKSNIWYNYQIKSRIMYQLLNKIFNIPVVHAQVGAANEMAGETQDQLTQLVSSVIAKIPLWITAFIVIVLTFVVARIVKSSVENKLATEGFEEEHKELSIVAGRSANAIVLTVGITVGLKIAGIDLTTIIAAGAFGIGFALKDLIMNFIAGVMILSSRHFSIGDIIKVKDVLGKVQEIQSRATVVKNFDGTKVVIPNAELFKNPVTSYTSNPFRRVTIPVGVEYGTDLKLALDACLKAALESKNALAQPKPSASIYEFGESSINIKVKVWVESGKGVRRTKSSLIQNIKKEFDAVGIGIPFPLRTIVFDEDAKEEKEALMKQKQQEDKKVDTMLEEKVEIDEPKPVEDTQKTTDQTMAGTTQPAQESLKPEPTAQPEQTKSPQTAKAPHQPQQVDDPRQTARPQQAPQQNPGPQPATQTSQTTEQPPQWIQQAAQNQPAQAPATENNTNRAPSAEANPPVQQSQPQPANTNTNPQ